MPKPRVLKPETYAKIDCVIDHISKTYLEKFGIKYPFLAEDIKHIKDITDLYYPQQVMALWDIFLHQGWDYKKDGELVKMPHSMRVFRSKLANLCEDQRWKARAASYEGPTNQKIADLIKEIEQKMALGK